MVPEPQKDSAGGQKPQTAAQNHTDVCKEAQLSAAGVEQVPQHTGQQTEAKKQIPQSGQRSRKPPQTAQQVINRTQNQTQRHRNEKFFSLDGYRQLHQAKRREKKPPLWLLSS